MSRIYAAGVEATAKANILSDLAGYLSYNDQGELVCDTAGLTNYLRAQFDSLTSEAVAPADATSVSAAAAAINVGALVSSLNDSIKVGAWSGRSDWPISTSAASGAEMVASVVSAMTECKQRSDELTNLFYDGNTKLAEAFHQFYGEQGVDALVPAGVVRDVKSRIVVCTYVTDFDEESAPSDPSVLVDMDQNDTATYTAPAPPSGRNIDRIRWYRSQDTNSGALIAGFVAEVEYDSGDATTLQYLDEKTDEELEEPCPTIGWEEPPENLQGLVRGANGGMAGFFDETVCPCVNNVPYAFRIDDRKTVGWPIVGLGTFGQTYVVLTRGKPTYLSGADSASLSPVEIDSDQACVSSRSIVSGLGGVKFASPDGICLANENGVKLITGQHFNREEWQALTPSSIFAAEAEGCYLFHYNNGVTTGCYCLDLVSGKLTTVDATGSAFYRDLVSDTLYLAVSAAIKAMFASGTNRTATWKSPKIVSKRYENLAWLQVDSDFEANVVVKLYRDGTLTDTKTLTTREAVRLSSVVAIEHEVQIESTADITCVKLAGDTAELKEL